MIVRSNALLSLAGRAVAIGAGLLVFAVGPTAPVANAAASGSFTASCQDIVDDGFTVRASCRRVDGTYNSSARLPYYICQSQIWNDNGNLQCLPSGSFKNSCNMIAWNEDFLTANCRRINGQYVMNRNFNYARCLNGAQDIANIDGALQCQ